LALLSFPLTQVDVESHSDEEESEQKASEGGDVCLYLVLVLRLSEQQSSEEGSEGVGETDACAMARCDEERRGER
jgi:hypothetical protein